ncbi:hypothetical protein D3C83_313480 [compost metagenome]
MKNDPQLAREIMVETIQDARTRVLELLLSASMQTAPTVLITSRTDERRGAARVGEADEYVAR